MSVHFKRKEGNKKREKSDFQLACEEAKQRRRQAEKQAAWDQRIAALLAKAQTLLNHPRPVWFHYETPTDWSRAIGQWENECEAVIKAADATRRPYWVNNWRKDKVLRLTTRKSAA